jgi:hypothetical protein
VQASSRNRDENIGFLYINCLTPKVYYSLITQSSCSRTNAMSFFNPSNTQQPALLFHLPSYGVLYVPHPHPRPYPAPPPLPPTELQGELEVIIPPEHGSCRVKGLELHLVSVCTLTGGPSDGVEINRIDKTLSGEGILGVGSHRFVPFG